jgi:hypothetical protein
MAGDKYIGDGYISDDFIGDGYISDDGQGRRKG